MVEVATNATAVSVFLGVATDCTAASDGLQAMRKRMAINNRSYAVARHLSLSKVILCRNSAFDRLRQQ